MAMSLINSLGSALVYPDQGNFVTNKKLWNLYAQEWSPSEDWVKDIARPNNSSQDIGSSSNEVDELKFVGQEWSPDTDLEEILQQFVYDYIDEDKLVAEIGCGGGRLAAKVAPRVKKMDCYDISKEMISQAEKALSFLSNVDFHILEEPSFSKNCEKLYDFIYCFDVMVHMDLHLINKYFGEIGRALKDDGKAFISTANITSTGGWARFSKQRKYTVGGFYFLCPEMVRFLLHKNGLRPVKEGPIEESTNVYLNRDYLVLVEKSDEVSP
uniref:Methyltransferase domain-containing protein n=1 Tax=Fibrocapsa japonica TaxID=94617 RepID=A0A7S2UUH0_9STRA